MEVQEEIKRLKQLVEQERQRADSAVEQANREQQRADGAEEQAQRTKEQIQRTTLTEYLSLCHEHLSKSISVQTNTAFTTKGSASNAKGKHRPDSLRSWGDYLDQHRNTLEILQYLYPHLQPQVFPSSHSVQSQAEYKALEKIASHADLEFFVRETMERPMTLIMQHLQSLESVREKFNLPQGFRFENHSNALSDAASEDVELTGAVPPQPSTPRQARNSQNTDDASVPKPRPDQFCIYTTVQGKNRVVLIAEFKPPHKLSLEMLRYLLRPDCPQTELDQIVNQITIPSSQHTDARAEYDAKEQVAAVITQAFSYMVRSETQYGYIITGEALVFLHIKLEDEMKTVYYYLLEPNREDSSAKELQQQAHTSPLLALQNTALSHILTFSFHALTSANENNQWRARIIPKLQLWHRHDQAVIAQLTPTPSTTGKSSVAYEPDPHALSESPTDPRPGSRKRSRHNCGPTSQPTTQNRDDSPPPPDDGSSHSGPVTRSAAAMSKGGRESRSSRDTSSYTSHHNRYSYCTQLCLQGLARGGPLDPRCPNVSKHCQEGYKGNTHQLSCEEFRLLLEKQLRQSHGNEFYELGIQGARGALFKVTLISHDYTVVAKGTVRAYVKYLRHEAEVYRQLAALQGVYVPVFLGSLDLDYLFYYDTGVRIVHMMLLSWSGDGLHSNISTDADKQTRALEIVRAVKAIHEAGIVHRDIREPNLLWNEEMKRPLVIDFERADIVKATPRPALSSMSPNKKRKRRCGKKMDDQKKDDKKDDEKKNDDRPSVATIMKKDPENKYRAELDLLAARDIFTPRTDYWASFF